MTPSSNPWSGFSHDPRDPAHATLRASDLVSIRALARPGATDLATASPAEIRARAVERYASDRREAVLGFLGPSLICWVIWSAVMFGGFPWPLFVMLGTGINLLRTVVRKSDIIDGHVRSLERKQAKALKPKKTEGPDQQ